jgi:ABC-type multidrug transport system ATPase subunit
MMMSQYISGNPYDLGRIVATLLREAAGGNWDGAAAGRAILESMSVRSSFIKPLDELLARRLDLSGRPGRYYLAPAGTDAAALARLDVLLGRACDWGRATFGIEAPDITLRLLDDFAAPTYAAFDTPDQVLIQMPASLLGGADLERLLWHELGHCLLRCGVRFLDEGFATWAELHRGGGGFDAAAAREAAARAAPSDQFTLSELLATGFTNALGFEDRVQDEAQRDSLYPKAALVIDALAQLAGAAGLRALFGAIKDNPEQALRLVKELAGERFAELGRLVCDGARAPAPAPALDQAAVRAEILAARGRCDGAALQALAGRLFEALPGAAPELPPLLVDAYVSARELSLRFEPARDKVAEKCCADLAKRRPEVYTLELSARFTLVKLIDAQHFLDRATLAAKATKFVQAACALNADAADALLTRAHLLIHTPVQYGGDPDAGTELLRRIARRADAYGPIALSIYKKNFGEEPAQPAAAALAEAPERALAADAAVLFSVKKLCFGKGADFSIELEHLEVRAGEVLGLIGPNGSGKSLLLECCLGLNGFASESHQLFGQDFAAWKRQLDQRRLVGAKLHRLGFDPSFRVADIVALARAGFGQDDAEAFRRFSIGALMKKNYGWLSTGQRQRVDLYFAFHREARLLFLDEPTLGLDDEYSGRLFELMAERSGQGAGILVVSHNQRILSGCHRIGVLAGGRLRALASPRELAATYLSDYRVDVGADAGAIDELAQQLGAIGAHYLIKRPDALIALGDPAFLAQFQALAARRQLPHYQVRRSELSDLYAVAGSFGGAAEGTA